MNEAHMQDGRRYHLFIFSPASLPRYHSMRDLYPGGGGELPYKKDGEARRKFWKEPPQEVKRSCFVGVAWIFFIP